MRLAGTLALPKKNGFVEIRPIGGKEDLEALTETAGPKKPGARLWPGGLVSGC